MEHQDGVSIDLSTAGLALNSRKKDHIWPTLRNLGVKQGDECHQPAISIIVLPNPFHLPITTSEGFALPYRPPSPAKSVSISDQCIPCALDQPLSPFQRLGYTKQMSGPLFCIYAQGSTWNAVPVSIVSVLCDAGVQLARSIPTVGSQYCLASSCCPSSSVPFPTDQNGRYVDSDWL